MAQDDYKNQDFDPNQIYPNPIAQQQTNYQNSTPYPVDPYNQGNNYTNQPNPYNYPPAPQQPQVAQASSNPNPIYPPQTNSQPYSPFSQEEMQDNPFKPTAEDLTYISPEPAIQPQPIPQNNNYNNYTPQPTNQNHNQNLNYQNNTNPTSYPQNQPQNFAYPPQQSYQTNNPDRKPTLETTMEIQKFEETVDEEPVKITKKSSSGSAILILLIVVLLGGLSGVGYFAYSLDQKNKVLESQVDVLESRDSPVGLEKLNSQINQYELDLKAAQQINAELQEQINALESELAGQTAPLAEPKE